MWHYHRASKLFHVLSGTYVWTWMCTYTFVCLFSASSWVRVCGPDLTEVRAAVCAHIQGQRSAAPCPGQQRWATHWSLWIPNSHQHDILGLKWRTTMMILCLYQRGPFSPAVFSTSLETFQTIWKKADLLFIFADFLFLFFLINLIWCVNVYMFWYFRSEIGSHNW